MGNSMNKKGFTLIEIIGAIIILGILMLIAITYVDKNMNRFRDDYYVSIENTILSSGKEFFTDNRKYLPSKYLESSQVSLNTLEGQKYLDEVLDYEGNSCNKDSYVIVIKKSKTEYDYYLCLICDEDNYDNTEKNECDSVWKSNDTLTIELGEPPIAYIYKGSTREEIKEKLKISADIVRYNNKGEEIARVNGEGEEGIPEILPSNIDTIDSTKVGEYETIYEYQGVTKKGKAIVYENSAPYIKMTQVNQVRVGKISNGVTEERTNYEGKGEWAQKLVIEFGEGNTEESKYGESGTTVSRYQWKRGERWTDFCIPSSGNSCSIEIDEEMNETIYFRAVDNEGNISKESIGYIIRIDNTAPLCELGITGTMGNNGWYRSNVTVSFTKTIDQIGSNNLAISGIKKQGITLDVIGTNQTGVQSTDTGSVTWYGVIEDNAKNSSLCSINFKRDVTPPVCQLKGSGLMSTSEYFGENVTVMFSSYTDNVSGVANYGLNSVDGPKTTIMSEENTVGVTYTGRIRDNAGNESSCSVVIKKKANWILNYNSNGGSDCASKTIVFNKEMGDLCTPTRGGHIFQGWYTSITDGTQVTSNTKLTVGADQTIYAHWYSCPPGQYAVAGATACSPCPSGQTSNGGATGCYTPPPPCERKRECGCAVQGYCHYKYGDCSLSGPTSYYKYYVCQQYNCC